MKIKHFFAFALVLMLFPIVVHANQIGYFKETITVDINCDDCNPWEEQEVTLQLYADGEEVEGKRVTLNKDVGYQTKFEELPMFKENTVTEIEYEVKYLKDGQFVNMPNKKINYKKKNIEKWVSVLPQDIQPDHDYLFLTDNWNYEQNGFSKYVVLRGDVTVKGAKPDSDYKLINGKESYYSLTAEPPANAVWRVTAAENGSWYLTNGEGKKLTVAGYNKGDSINYIFKHSGKVGYNSSDDSFNNNIMVFDPIAETLGRFYITGMGQYHPDAVTESFVPSTEDTPQYLGLNFNNQVEAQVERDYGAQFLAFEYYEGEAEVMTDISVSMDLCEKAPVVNPDTVDNIVKYVAIFGVSIVLIAGSIFLIRRKSDN